MYTPDDVSRELTDAAYTLRDIEGSGIDFEKVGIAVEAVKILLLADRISREREEVLADEFTPEQIQKTYYIRNAIRSGKVGWVFGDFSSVVPELERLHEDLQKIADRSGDIPDIQSVGESLGSFSRLLMQESLPSSALTWKMILAARSRLEAVEPGSARDRVAKELLRAILLAYGVDIRQLLEETVPAT